MLENKDYCDYDTCVALKELGFKQLVDWYFNEGKNIVPLHARYRNTFVPRITLYEAQTWLREEHNLHIDVRLHGIIGYQYEVWTFKRTIAVGREFLTYEEALTEGIKEAVKILKEK